MCVYSWIPSEFKIAIVRIRKEINDIAMKLFVQVVRETWTVFKTLPILVICLLQKERRRECQKLKAERGRRIFQPQNLGGNGPAEDCCHPLSILDHCFGPVYWSPYDMTEAQNVLMICLLERLF